MSSAMADAIAALMLDAIDVPIIAAQATVITHSRIETIIDTGRCGNRSIKNGCKVYMTACYAGVPACRNI